MSFDDENAVISLLNEDQIEMTSCIEPTNQLKGWNNKLLSSFNQRLSTSDMYFNKLESNERSGYKTQYHCTSSSKLLHNMDENRISRLYRELQQLKNLCAQQDAVIVDLQKRYKEKDNMILHWKNKAEAHGKTALDSIMELGSKKKNIKSCQCTELKALKESLRSMSLENNKMHDIIQSLQERLEGAEKTCQHQMTLLKQYQNRFEIIPSFMNDRIECTPPSKSTQSIILNPLTDKRATIPPDTFSHNNDTSSKMQKYQLQEKCEKGGSILKNRPKEQNFKMHVGDLLNETSSSNEKSMKIEALYRRMSAH